MQTNEYSRSKRGFRSFVKEIRIFVIFFVVVTVTMLVVTNFNLFAMSFQNLFTDSITQIQDVDGSDIYADKGIASVLIDAEQDSAEIQALLVHYQSGRMSSKSITSSQESLLISKLKEYPFDFNTLPPINKMLIPALGIDVPIVEVKTKAATDFIQGNYDDELTQGVVKYPTTPAPGSLGNSLIFGHTSQEFRKKNTYGTIFKDIPKLTNGDVIKVIREGNLYEYQVVDKFIVLPKQVNAQYMSYQNAGGSYVTLMGCYPLGTDKKRVMVVAKLIE